MGVTKERAEALARVDRLLTLMNAFEYALCIAINERGSRRFKNAAITHEHLIKIRVNGSSMSIGTIAKGLLKDARSNVENSPRVLGGYTVVPTVALDRAAQILNAITGCAYNKSAELITLIHRGASAYQDHSFDQAVILAWAVIEACQSELWKQCIEESIHAQGLQMNKERRKKLRGTRTLLEIIGEVADDRTERAHLLPVRVRAGHPRDRDLAANREPGNGHAVGHRYNRADAWKICRPANGGSARREHGSGGLPPRAGPGQPATG